MPTFPEALDSALTQWFKVPGTPLAATHRSGLLTRMRQLTKLHGGNSGAAAASAGIPARTWRDWKAGTHPPSTRSLRRLEGAYARQIIAPAVSKLTVTKPVKHIHVEGDVVVDPKDRRYVNSTVHRWFRAEKISTSRVVNAWLNQGMEGAAQAYVAAVFTEYRSVFAFEGDNCDVDLG